MQFLKHFSARKISWVFILILAITAAALWAAAVAATPSNTLTFAVMDVGQGDALYIESPTGVQVVIDGGPNSSILRELAKLMPYGDRTIDAVIATHPDQDHIGGLVDLFERFEVSTYISPGIPKDTLTVRALAHMVEETQTPHYLARRGMVLDLGSGAYLQVLFPDHDVSNLPSNKTNEGSVVARLVYGESDVLLMGDATTKVEGRLVVLDKEVLKSDVLKIGHHGSKTSTGNTFLSVVRPEVAIISVGASNRYGHPTDEVLSRLQEKGIQILRTNERGTIRCLSNGLGFLCD